MNKQKHKENRTGAARLPRSLRKKAKAAAVFIAAVCFALLPSASLLADMILFRNGKRVYGVLRNQDIRNVYFMTGRGLRKYPKKVIRRISFGATAEEKRKSADLKRRLQELMRAKRMSLEKKKKAILALQNEIDVFFKKQEKRREIAEKLDTEFQKAYEAERKGPSSIIRQAVFPGWGFYYLGENKKAIIYGATFSALFLRTFYLRSSALKSKAKYDDSTVTLTMLSFARPEVFGANASLVQASLVEPHYQEYRKKISRYNFFTKVLFLTYLGSMGHLVWDNWFSKKNVKDDKKAGVLEYRLDILPDETPYQPVGPGIAPSAGQALRFSLSTRF